MTAGRVFSGQVSLVEPPDLVAETVTFCSHSLFHFNSSNFEVFFQKNHQNIRKGGKTAYIYFNVSQQYPKVQEDEYGSILKRMLTLASMRS